MRAPSTADYNSPQQIKTGSVEIRFQKSVLLCEPYCPYTRSYKQWVMFDQEMEQYPDVYVFIRGYTMLSTKTDYLDVDSKFVSRKGFLLVATVY